MDSIDRKGRADAAIDAAPTQPGRMSSVATHRASSRLASTALVVGRITAAGMLRVAISTNAVNSTRPTTPSSSCDSNIQGSGVDLHQLPGANRIGRTERAVRWLAQGAAVRADPVACRP